MNFLAHLYLSGGNTDLLIGNFIGDSVTSRMRVLLAPEIQRGVLLHQAIDTFTDSHPVVRKSKERLRPRYRKYASVIVDVFYDHFLAKHWSKYSNKSLRSFADETYDFLEEHKNTFPPRSLHFYQYMRQTDVLVLYATVAGIDRVMKGMAHRASFESGMETCAEELQMHYIEFEKEFQLFFPDLVAEAAAFLSRPIK
jgi:acyl carrier protein phosphodiesterase